MEQYEDIIRMFRIEVPIKHAKECGIPFEMHGKHSEGLEKILPVFGREGSSLKALNSGGRGVLFPHEDKVYRLKGCDLDGSITYAVAESENNCNRTVSEVKVFANPKSFRWGKKAYTLQSVFDKPFSLFTLEQAKNESLACECTAEEFERAGYIAPYSIAAVAGFPGITWGGEAMNMLIFKIPSPESDLRYVEFQRYADIHLRFASEDELASIKDPLCETVRSLTSWYGFSARTLAENKLCPSPGSHLEQNYVISHVAESSVGLARVDHTSTIQNDTDYYAYLSLLKKQFMFLAETPITLLRALREEPCKDIRSPYTSALWRKEPAPLSSNPELKEYVSRLKDAFNRGYERDPMPLPVKDLAGLFSSLSGIEISYDSRDWLSYGFLKIPAAFFMPIRKMQN